MTFYYCDCCDTGMDQTQLCDGKCPYCYGEVEITGDNNRMNIQELVKLVVSNHSGPMSSDKFYEELVAKKMQLLPIPHGVELELDEFNSKSVAFQRCFVHGDISHGRKAAMIQARYPELDGYLNAIYEMRIE